MHQFSQNISYLAIVGSDRLNLYAMSTKTEESNTQVSTYYVAMIEDHSYSQKIHPDSDLSALLEN